MIKLEDGRTGLDQRHIAIAERYWDKVIAPDGTMTRSWLVMLLAQVALEGERLTDQPAPTETRVTLRRDCTTCGAERATCPCRAAYLARTAPQGAPSRLHELAARMGEPPASLLAGSPQGAPTEGAPACDNPECDEACQELHPTTNEVVK